MYNRYIPNGASYARITEDDGIPPAPTGQTPRPASTEPETHRTAAPPDSLQAPGSAPETPAPAEEGKKGGLSGLLKGLKLDDLDTGDILLLLIVLFLFLEGDDVELIITLGLLLILGL